MKKKYMEDDNFGVKTRQRRIKFKAEEGRGWIKEWKR